MGARGPVPKRSTERRRRNKESKPDTITVIGTKVKAPPPKATWHATMKDWYVALTKSGQAQLYQPSEWAEARLWCDVMSTALKSPRPMSAHLLLAFSAFSSRLLTTEGDRRRMRLELERDDEPQQSASVTAIDDYRRRAGAQKR